MAKRLSKWKLNFEITNRDIRILKYLWRWKAMTTHALNIKFFPGSKLLTGYRRLVRLEDAGYIQSVSITTHWQCVWTLTAKGFKQVNSALGDVQCDGFKVEYPLHDHLATAFHLGEWLTHQPEYTQTFTEQQLRRIPMDLWDEWVPKSDTHRPDGYSLYFHEDKKIVVAFEAELTLKTKPRYESVVVFYDSQPTINLVFWLIESKSTLKSIQRVFESFHVREMLKHHFILLSDFQKFGWNAPFVGGKFIGKSPADFLMSQGLTKSSPSIHHGDTLALLETNKKPKHSITSNSIKKS